MSFLQEGNENSLDPITYGSVLTLSDPSEPNSYLFANGFSTNGIFVRCLNPKLEDIHRGMKIKETQSLSFSSCLFLISPTFSNNLKQDALALIKRGTELQKKEELQNDEDFNEDSSSSKLMEEISTQKLQQTKGKILSEYKANMELFNKYRGRPISFNHSFQLLHLDSYKYLACYDQEADKEKENYRLQLDEHPSERSIFKITPAFKYQKEAEQTLTENETVLITHSNRRFRKEVYLHKSEIKLVDKTKREVNASSEQKSLWKLQLFASEFIEDSVFLKSGDIIWIYHSELNASLSAVKKMESFHLFHLKRKRNLVEKEEGKIEEDVHIEFIKNNSIEEKFEDFKGNTCGVWILEAENLKKGKKIEYGENFRLKHLKSGRYLTIKRDQINKKPILALESLSSKTQIEEYQQKNTFFNFFPINSLLSANSSQNIPINSFTYIRNLNSKKWLDATMDQKWQENNEEQDICNIGIIPMLKENFSEQEIFRVRKAPMDLIWQLKFLNSYYPILSNFNENILKSSVNYFFLINIQYFKKKQSFDKLVLDDLIKIEGKIGRTIVCIENLDLFCRNKIGNKTFDQKFGEMNSSRQNVDFLIEFKNSYLNNFYQLMREQLYIEIIISILMNLFTKSELQLVDYL